MNIKTLKTAKNLEEEIDSIRNFEREMYPRYINFLIFTRKILFLNYFEFEYSTKFRLPEELKEKFMEQLIEYRRNLEEQLKSL